MKGRGGERLMTYEGKVMTTRKICMDAGSKDIDEVWEKDGKRRETKEEEN